MATKDTAGHAQLVTLLEHDRLRRNRSARRQADDLGIASSTLSRIETGGRPPSRNFFYRLGKLLEVDPVELFERYRAGTLNELARVRG